MERSTWHNTAVLSAPGAVCRYSSQRAQRAFVRFTSGGRICPFGKLRDAQAVLPLVGLAAEKVIRDQYNCVRAEWPRGISRPLMP
ncbi:MAG: hypothetical protein ACQESR_30720 [Planctomycetota bacterium]